MSGQEARIDAQRIPAHVAIIMDGNGRWAQQRGQDRIYGHRYAVQAVRETCEICAELGVRYLTLYTFSTENWSRPVLEVEALMQLLVETVQSELDTLMKNKIALHSFGDLDLLPARCLEELKRTEQLTSANQRMQLNLAISYSARSEILSAVKKIAEDVKAQKLDPNQIDEFTVAQRLQTALLPDPDLMIRTSGEQRLSNFLLWQSAYTELYFTETCWPDFRKADFLAALQDYQQRERRFGKTSAQTSAQS
jgi:undecaprenyl diphosphate synthase